MILLLTPRATRVRTSISRALSERSTGPRLRLTSLLATEGESTESPRAVARMARNHDQPDHAARLTRLGIAHTMPRERYEARRAAAELGTLLGDETALGRAARVGCRVRSETGVATACRLLTQLLERNAA